MIEGYEIVKVKGHSLMYISKVTIPSNSMCI